MAIALGMRTKQPGETMTGQPVELVAHSNTSAAMTPYERLLGDALEGQRELFASQQAVEAEWNVVDDVLAQKPPLERYDAGSWGPLESDRLTESVGGWYRPRNDSDGSS